MIQGWFAPLSKADALSMDVVCNAACGSGSLGGIPVKGRQLLTCRPRDRQLLRDVNLRSKSRPPSLQRMRRSDDFQCWLRTVSYHEEKINFSKFEFLSYLDAPWHCQQNIIKSYHSTQWFLRFFKKKFFHVLKLNFLPTTSHHQPVEENKFLGKK